MWSESAILLWKIAPSVGGKGFVQNLATKGFGAIIGSVVIQGQDIDAHAKLVAGMSSGTLAPARVDASLRRILAIKERFGILDNTAPSGTAGSDADRATADELARASITVLRSAGLPLRGKIFVASPMTPDIALVPDQPTLGAVLAQRLPNVTAQTITLSPDQAAIDRAVTAARAADVVVLGTADLFSYPQQAALAKALVAVKPVPSWNC